MKQNRRFLSLVMALCLLFSCVLAVSATDTQTYGASIGPGVSAIADRHNLIFGGNTAQWLVLDSDATTVNTSGIAVISEEIIACDVAFNAGGLDNAWANSDAKAWLANFAAEFDAAALNYIMDTTKEADAGVYFNENWGEDALSAEKFFFLSAAEADKYFYYDSIDGLIAEHDGVASGWWLRSAYADRDIHSGVVSDAGFVGYTHIASEWGARPAFNISADSVAVSSAAVGGKVSGEVGADSLTEVVENTTDEWKLTLIDDAHSSFTASFEGATVTDGINIINQTSGYSSWTIPVTYSGAVAGENEYVSVLICNQIGEAVYYGHIANNSESGTVNVNMPAGLSGVYNIYVYAEQCNGDNTTDFGSDLTSAKLIVSDEISSVHSWGLTLEGDIRADFALVLADSVIADTSAYISVTVDGASKKINVSDLEEKTLSDGTQAYMISINVAAAQMTEKILLQTVTSDVQGSEFIYSVRAYGDYILSKDDYSDATKNLVKAMLVYGGKAQDYFQYNTDNLADNGITVEKVEIPYTEGLAATKNGSSENVTFYGASLIHEHQTGLRFYFNSTDSAISGVTFNATLADGSVIEDLLVYKTNSMYYVEISDIAPQLLCDEITVSVDGLEVTYSPFHYMHRMYYRASSTRVMCDMMQAMYNYYHYAAAYMEV